MRMAISIAALVACTAYLDPEHPGRNPDTPQREGLRQAGHDQRYALTLEQLIE